MTRLEVDPGRPGDAACTDIARARAPHHQSRDGIVGTAASATSASPVAGGKCFADPTVHITPYGDISERDKVLLGLRGASSRRRVRGRGDHRHPPREIPLDDVHDRVCGLEEVLPSGPRVRPGPSAARRITR